MREVLTAPHVITNPTSQSQSVTDITTVERFLMKRRKGLMSEGKKDFWTLATVLAVVVLGWSFYINPDLLTKTRAFLGDTLSDSKTTAAVLSAAFAFATLGVQFWVGARQAKIGSSQAEASRTSADAAMLTAKSSGNRAVASMRIKWVEELRQVLSEYHSVLMTVDGERTRSTAYDDYLAFNEHMEGDGETVFRHACKLGLEGIVSKRKDSAYRSGRSPDWLKMKNSDAPAVKREEEEEWGAFVGRHGAINPAGRVRSFSTRA
jgi:hypothetical protein